MIPSKFVTLASFVAVASAMLSVGCAGETDEAAPEVAAAEAKTESQPIQCIPGRYTCRASTVVGVNPRGLSGGLYYWELYNQSGNTPTSSTCTARTYSSPLQSNYAETAGGTCVVNYGVANNEDPYTKVTLNAANNTWSEQTCTWIPGSGGCQL